MRRKLGSLWRSQDGATSIEYGLLASFVAVTMILGATTLGSTLSGTFLGVAHALVVDGGADGSDAENAGGGDSGDGANGNGNGNGNNGVGQGNGGSNGSNPNAGGGNG